MTAIWNAETSLGDLIRSGQGQAASRYLPALHVTAEPYNPRHELTESYSLPSSLIGSLGNEKQDLRPWVNDPTRFIWDGNVGLFRAWVLTFDNYDNGLRTWLEVVSPDLNTWIVNRIPFYTADLPAPDMWGGCAFIDERGTAGYGAGAVIYIVSVPAGDPGHPDQSQARFIAPALGLAPVYDGIVLNNPEEGDIVHAPGMDFRDPRVDWDDVSGQWVMKLTVGRGIAFYGSPDTKNWTFLSLIDLSDWQQIETPDLLPMTADDGTSKWLLAFSLKTWDGQPYSTCGYLIGTWNGKSFTPDSPTPRLINHGHDFYAQALSPHDGDVYCWAWMGNWTYAGKLPTKGFLGNQTVVTKLGLAREADGYGLRMDFLEAQEKAYETATDYQNIRLAPSASWSPGITNPGVCWRVDFSFLPLTGTDFPDSVTFTFCAGGKADNQTALTFDMQKRTVTLSRARSGSGPVPSENQVEMQAEWVRDRTAPLPDALLYSVSILFDASTVEIIINSQVYLSSLILPPDDAFGMALSVSGKNGLLLNKFSLFC